MISCTYIHTCTQIHTQQVNFHTTQVGEAMVTLVYHKRLDDVWQEAAKKLRSLLAQAPSTHGRMPHVIGELDVCCKLLVSEMRVTDYWWVRCVSQIISE